MLLSLTGFSTVYSLRSRNVQIMNYKKIHVVFKLFN